MADRCPYCNYNLAWLKAGEVHGPVNCLENLKARLEAAQGLIKDYMAELREICAILGGPDNEKSGIDLS